LILEQGFKEQIRQLTGMRGLMAKPKNLLLVVGKLLKTGLSNFKEIFSVASILFLLTVRVKVLRIQRENCRCRIFNKEDCMMYLKMLC
jgi:DNA-directed RNA polymerase subunit beta'